MMIFDEACQVLRRQLLEINSQSEELEKRIEGFADTVLILPSIMVKRRLLLIGEQILLRSGSLMAEHNGGGWVFVTKSDILLGVYWEQNEFPQKVKDHFKKRGFVILTPAEIMASIGKLCGKVDSGQFAEAVDWVNRYEPSFARNQG